MSLFDPLGRAGSDLEMGTRCGVYHCTMTVSEHAPPPMDPDTGEWLWDEVVHYNEDDHVGFVAPMPERWRDG